MCNIVTQTWELVSKKDKIVVYHLSLSFFTKTKIVVFVDKMAQFITQGRLKLLFSNGEGGSFGLEPKDPFHYNKLRSVQTHLRRLRFLGFTTTRFFFSSSSSYVNNKSSSTFNLEACLRVSDSEGVYDDDDDNDFDHNDELERDDLSCFRGLVLDISYRSLSSLLVTHLLTVFYFYNFFFIISSICLVELNICIWVVAFYSKILVICLALIELDVWL